MTDRDFIGHANPGRVDRRVYQKRKLSPQDRSRLKYSAAQNPTIPQESVPSTRRKSPSPLPVLDPALVVSAPRPSPQAVHVQMPRINEAIHNNIANRPIKSRSKRSRFSTQNLMVGMAVIVFVTGMLVSIQTFLVNKDSEAQVVALSKKSEDSDSDGVSGSQVPSEDKPRNIRSYRVAPGLPKFIKIPKLGVDSRVKPLGVDNDNQMKAPANIYDTGWYQSSAKPGDAGSMGAVLINGHMHGPRYKGVFYGLKQLVAGDTIQVVRGDNKVINYKVVRVQNYDAKSMDMGMMLTSVQPGKHGLNLITCGGKYNKKTNEYQERTAVFAVAQ